MRTEIGINILIGDEKSDMKGMWKKIVKGR